MSQNFLKKERRKRISLAVVEKKEKINLAIAKKRKKINLVVVEKKKEIQLIYSYFTYCKEIVKVIKVVIVIQ